MRRVQKQLLRRISCRTAYGTLIHLKTNLLLPIRMLLTLRWMPTWTRPILSNGRRGTTLTIRKTAAITSVSHSTTCQGKLTRAYEAAAVVRTRRALILLFYGD